MNFVYEDFREAKGSLSEGYWMLCYHCYRQFWNSTFSRFIIHDKYSIPSFSVPLGIISYLELGPQARQNVAVKPTHSGSDAEWRFENQCSVTDWSKWQSKVLSTSINDCIWGQWPIPNTFPPKSWLACSSLWPPWRQFFKSFKNLNLFFFLKQECVSSGRAKVMFR